MQVGRKLPAVGLGGPFWSGSWSAPVWAQGSSSGPRPGAGGAGISWILSPCSTQRASPLENVALYCMVVGSNRERCDNVTRPRTPLLFNDALRQIELRHTLLFQTNDPHKIHKKIFSRIYKQASLHRRAWYFFLIKTFWLQIPTTR